MNISKDWLPTPESINALPKPLTDNEMRFIRTHSRWMYICKKLKEQGKKQIPLEPLLRDFVGRYFK